LLLCPARSCIGIDCSLSKDSKPIHTKNWEQKVECDATNEICHLISAVEEAFIIPKIVEVKLVVCGMMFFETRSQ